MSEKVQEKESAKSGCWFLTINNPLKHLVKYGLPENSSESDIVDWCLQHWIQGKETRGAGACFEVGEKGTPHVHIACCSTVRAKFSTMKNCFPPADIRRSRGTADEIRGYLEKSGKHEDKKTTQIVPARYAGIDILDSDLLSPGESFFDIVDARLADGAKPADLYAESAKFAQYANAIERAFYARAYREVPPLRELEVIYHTGQSGSGKSFSRLQYEVERPDDIYVVSGTAWDHPWDNYQNEPILFLDDLRSSDIKYNALLNLLDVYRLKLSARYADKFAAWTRVEITSVIPIESLYFKETSQSMSCLSAEEAKAKKHESFTQLIRRISTIRYHYVDPSLSGDERFRYIDVPASEYTCIEDVERMAAERMAAGHIDGVVVSDEVLFDRLCDIEAALDDEEF